MGESGEMLKMFLELNFHTNNGDHIYKIPNRASEISRDIMGFVSPLFKSIYNINISFETTKSGVWHTYVKEI